MKPIQVRLLLKLFLLITVLSLLAQDLPNVIPPSPTVANLMTFEEVPIDYHTGQPNISIPLFSRQVHKDLVLNSSLRYSTQGVKIDSHSGWTGTGWSLNLGGIVSRTIRGLPDEYNFSDKKGVLHIADFWNYYNLSIDERNEYEWNVLGTSAIKLDSELDLYQFSFNGHQGRFVVVKENGVLKAKIVSNVSNVRIDIDYDPTSLAINEFTLTDLKGLKYTFSVRESSLTNYFTATMTQQGSPKILFAGTSGSAGSGGRSIVNRDNTGKVVEIIGMPGGINFEGAAIDDGGFEYNFSSDEVSYTSGWFLSSIKTSNDHSLVDFSYDSDNVSYEVSKSFTENRIEEIFGGATMEAVTGNLYNRGNLEPLKKVNFHQVQISTHKVSEVSFKDGTSWVVAKDESVSHPETTGMIIKSIAEFNLVDTVRKVSFDFDTVAGRLWLMSLIDSDRRKHEDMSYQFAYNDKSNLNEYGSPRDIWGYNNSPINPVYDPEVPLPFDEDIIDKGLLSSIRFPTGGSQHFDFEHNTFSFAQGGALTFDEYIQSPQNFDYKSNNIMLSGSYDLTASSGLIATESINLTHPQSILIKIPQMNADQSLIDNMRLVVLDDQGNQENQVGIEVDRGVILDLEAGSKTLRLEALNADTYTIEGIIRTYYQELNSVLDEFMIGGGVRIKSIEYRDGLQLLKKINYSYNDPNQNQKSSGAVDGIYSRLRLEYNHTVTKSLFSTNTNWAEGFASMNIRYRVATQNGNNANISKGGYVTYKHVKISEEGNGHQQYTYTNTLDYPSPSATFIMPYSPPAPDFDFKRGLVLKHEIFNESGQILKANDYTYTFELDTLIRSFKVLDLKTCPYRQFYDSYSDEANGFPSRNVPLGPDNNQIFPQPYVAPPLPSCSQEIYFTADEHTIGWAKQTGSNSIEYFYDDQNSQRSVQTFQKMWYNPENYQVSDLQRASTESGKTINIQIKNYYPLGTLPSGYTETDGTNALASINRVNEVVYSEKIRTEGDFPNQISYLLSTTKNVFHQFGNGAIGLKEVHTSRGNENLEKRIDIFSYDEYGNILELAKKGTTDSDIHTVYLWGYNHSVPVVQINDISLAEIDESIRDNIGTATETNIINYVNSLRITFQDKQITSFLYDEGLKLKEVKDPNGLTTLYEYDGLGRLTLVKDYQGNLIKEITYKAKY